jgi:hypothetical protein
MVARANSFVVFGRQSGYSFSRDEDADVTTLGDLRLLIVGALAEWRSLRLEDLRYWHRSEAHLLLAVLTSVAGCLLIAHVAFRARAGRGLLLPALLRIVPQSRAAAVRHVPLLLLLAGLPFFAVALADPYSAMIRREATHPGRRIGLLIDASVSMRKLFTAETLNTRGASDGVFFTSVAAAERFVQLRLKSRYRDLVALVEFGSRAYVVTPFTNDYANILFSISLIADPIEFQRFPDPGTVIASGIDDALELFKAFNFLDASGNLLVVFSDGEDSTVALEHKTLDEILQSAVEAKIPVYFVRTNYGLSEGEVIPDQLWRPAVEKTGGRFYAVRDERALLAAIQDIDRAAIGTIEIKQYSSPEPRFTSFALIAAACWIAAAALKLGLPHCQKMT